MSELPRWNDNEVDLLRRICANTAGMSGGGGTINVQGGGISVTPSATIINFVGAGVAVTDVGGTATITIPGGGGGAYPSVANFAALPAAAAHTGETYLVLNAQGTIWLGTRKPRGLYDSDGANWTYDADQTTDYFSGVQPTAGQIPVGNGTVFATQTVSGDATLSAGGALTIANDAITNAKLANMANSTIKARITAGTGDPEDATVAQIKTLLAYTATDIGLGNVTNAAQTLASIVPNTAPAAGQILVGNAGGTAYAPVTMSGNATLASTGALTIAAGVVTLAMMANLAQDQFIGRATASTGVPQTATITAAARTVLDDATTAAMLATLGGMANPMTTGGDIIYGGAAGVPTRLANGTVGQVLTSGGTTVAPSWTTPAGGGTVTATGGALTANSIVLGAGGTDTKVVAGIITDGTSKVTLGVAGTSVGSIDFKNATSGTITLAPVTGALGTVTISLPAATDTLVGKATTDTLTNKTLTAPRFADLGFIADANGNELIILDTVTSAVNEVTFANAATAGIPTFTASGGDTNVSIDFVPKGTHITDSTIRYGGTEIGFRQIPQNSQSAAYTTVATDRGKHILHPSSDANTRTFTIDSHANVPYPLGTVITFINRTSQVLSIAITTDTLILANTTTTGTRSLAQNGIATAIKTTFGAGPDIWIINGTGLT